MGIIMMIILGAFVGWIASILTKRDAEQGWIGNILVGVAGAFVGGFVSRFFTGSDKSALAFDLGALIWALVGAIILSVILNYISDKNN